MIYAIMVGVFIMNKIFDLSVIEMYKLNLYLKYINKYIGKSINYDVV